MKYIIDSKHETMYIYGVGWSKYNIPTRPIWNKHPTEID